MTKLVVLKVCCDLLLSLQFYCGCLMLPSFNETITFFFTLNMADIAPRKITFSKFTRHLGAL